MVQAPQRTAFSGPSLIRLLARLTAVDVPESRQSLSDQLTQWLGWADAISLSAALQGNPCAISSGVRTNDRAEEREYTRVRTSLLNAIVGDSAFSAARPRGAALALRQGPPMNAVVDYAVFRQRYLALQQTMEMDIGNLRSRLRGMLVMRTPGMARLAAVDAVMEQALSPRERSLLAAVPGLLSAHFMRLREAYQEKQAMDPTSGDAAAVTSDLWLGVFRKDMQSVLLAELDVRFQPVEGLLAALRSS